MDLDHPERHKHVVTLDEDHLLIPFVGGPNDTPAGWFVIHRPGPTAPGPSEKWCWGSISRRGFGHGRDEWDVLSEDPLTVQPSILCSCSVHGYITDGKWVECP